MTYDLPEEVATIIKKFIDANYQIYIVGGAVRDLIMNREVNDWDFTTDATPEQILQVIPEGYYNNQFGTVGVKLANTSTSQVAEITTMRQEGEYHDSRHPEEVSWTDQIELDLARRDFTINAIALRVIASPSATLRMKQSWQLVDPFNGRADINAQVIRAVGDPDKRFQEDALRLIRAIRIATQLEFEVDQETFQAVIRNRGLLSNIAWERIRDELFKILSSVNPYIGIIKLKEVGILEIILPEVSACFGIQQEGEKHDRIYDVGDHLLQSLKHCPSTDPLTRLATLIHDIGKFKTYRKDNKGNVTFYHHEVVGSKQALAIAERFNLSKKQTDKLIRLVRWHQFTVDTIQTDSAIRRFIKNVGLENIDDMLALRIGDRLGGGTQRAVSWRMEEFQSRIQQVLKKPFSISDLKVNGQDVMDALNIPPSRKVGEVLKKLFKEVEVDASKNEREYLLARIKSVS